MTGWKFCRTLSPQERMEIYEYRRGKPDEALTRKQALGIEIQKRWIERMKSIPKHRSLVVVPQTAKVVLKIVKMGEAK